MLDLPGGRDSGASGCAPHSPQSQPRVAAGRKEQEGSAGSFLHSDLMNSSWKVTFASLCLSPIFSLLFRKMGAFGQGDLYVGVWVAPGVWSDGTEWRPLPLPVLMPQACDLGEAIRSSQIKRKLSSPSATRTPRGSVTQGVGRLRCSRPGGSPWNVGPQTGAHG